MLLQLTYTVFAGFWYVSSTAMCWTVSCALNLIIDCHCSNILLIAIESVIFIMPQFGKPSSEAKKRLQHQLYLVCIWLFKTFFIDVCLFFQATTKLMAASLLKQMQIL